MPITIGTRLGSHEIIALLGKGGMGEVYRARDLKLKREVAIKIIPDEFARDPDRVSRFQREAEALASVNHQNIAAIYDVQEADGVRFLILELVEGETLADRLGRGPLPIEEALNLGLHVCEALEAAHEKGIIHRDLKPANVKVTPDGKVKVLDFGLAKALESTPSNGTMSNSPTLSLAATAAGVIIGTAAYMSPEQARGRNADQRSDVFSFGCVLFEMLTGRQVFHGEEVSDILASVLKDQPDVTLLPPGLNPRLPDLIRRSLDKNPRRRWQAIGDLRMELEAIVAEPYATPTSKERGAPAQKLWKRVIPALVASLAAAAITAAVMWSIRPPTEPRRIARFSFSLPADQNFTRTGHQVAAISHDGANVVYLANGQLYLKPISELEAKPIPGTNQDVDTPMFSPDGQWLAFVAPLEGKLKKIPISGGASVTLGDVNDPFGASWDFEDQIILGQGPKGIVRVPAGGGKPETLIPGKTGELFDGPQLLPGGENLLFTLGSGRVSEVARESRWDSAQVAIQNLKSGERKILIEAGGAARYVSTGHILYTVGGTVFAVPFDLEKTRVTGGPVPILEGVRRSSGQDTAAAFFGLSDTGSLIWIPGDGNAVIHHVLVLSDRSGGKKILPIPVADYVVPRISPDGKHLAVGIREAKDRNIWIHDFNSNTSMRRLTFGGQNQDPMWTPDGKRIVFRSDRDGEGLYWQPADGSGTAERLTKADKGTYHAPTAWTPDGKILTYYLNYTANRGDLWMVSIEGDRKPKQLLTATSGNLRRLSFSPDGRWSAYSSSEESDVVEVYVQPFPTTGAKYKITKIGADSPQWTPDGKQLIFESKGKLMSVDLQTKPGFTFSEPKPLPVDVISTGSRPYDITPDGKLFLVIQSPPQTDSAEKRPPQINTVLNWFEELKQRVPVH